MNFYVVNFYIFLMSTTSLPSQKCLEKATKYKHGFNRPFHKFIFLCTIAVYCGNHVYVDVLCWHVDICPIIIVVFHHMLWLTSSAMRPLQRQSQTQKLTKMKCYDL